jgi:ferric-dicitrate binding protein FerR (iron transport regulator)
MPDVPKVESAGLSRRSILRLTAVPFLLMSAPETLRAEVKVGTVEDVKGQAFAENGAARRKLDRAAPVFLKDAVATAAASRLSMQLGTDTSVKLGERTRLVIDRYLVKAGGQITLGSGAMLLDRTPGSAPQRLDIRSPFGLIAVRGTQFFAGRSNNVFGVFVARGRVTVSAAGRRVTLRAGEGTDIRRVGAQPTPPARWGKPRIRAALASVS